jgi:catechol 2,3-dioxygenase-like lactoylglutathione lyase family enzyme
MDRVTPTMPSRDLAATSAFYARLGFREVFRDAGWLIVARGPLQLEFFPHPDLDPCASYGGGCLRVSDAQALRWSTVCARAPANTRVHLHRGPHLTKPSDDGRAASSDGGASAVT